MVTAMKMPATANTTEAVNRPRRSSTKASAVQPTTDADDTMANTQALAVANALREIGTQNNAPTIKTRYMTCTIGACRR
jgi:hypothetical protein